ncbi:uncharacterized protein LOC124261592 [Haliotis rubra]|uniref:uncharacterized protein LOC124261592 n=1 Tax=Haliotis rubra TaxID=36100 RepID=UPI001EE53C47|nr:uncharacterized protein LOC124261592 [Haliotis rubra]
MVECCHRLQHHNTTPEQLILLAPCPPPWKLDLLQHRGEENNIPPDVISAINHRCQRQLLRHVMPVQDESKCVGGCRIGASSAAAVTVLIIILGLVVWKLKSRQRKHRLPRVRIRNPVMDLKNKIELSIITLDGDSILSYDSGASNEAYSTTDFTQRRRNWD